MLIILPNHLRVSGVSTWAARTVELLRSRGEPAGLLVHTHGQAVPEFLEPLIVERVTTSTPIEMMGADIHSLIPIYTKAIRQMRPADGSPTVVAPCVPGDCYGIVGKIAQSDPQGIRILSWIHADNAYDLHVASYYAPMLHAFVPVSRELTKQLKTRIPDRAADIQQIDHAVEVPVGQPDREPFIQRKVRLIYTGRLDQEQKRVHALPGMVDHLLECGIPFEFKIVGDGPASAELKAAFESQDCVELVGAVAPEEIPVFLAWADAWVNPSRYEGQCVAMLEAMGMGCVPIMTRVDSGQAGIVEHERTGLIANAGPHDSPTQTGVELAKAVEHFVRCAAGRMPAQAASYVQKYHHPSTYTDRIVALIDRVRMQPPRSWPADRPVEFSAPKGGVSGSTPPQAASLMRSILEELNGRRVLIYGIGKHTTDLREVLARHEAEIVGMLDDHTPIANEHFLQWPVVQPEAAHELGGTDVVISSFIHEQAIWSKRAILEKQGLVVHRLYHESGVEGDQAREPTSA